MIYRCLRDSLRAHNAGDASAALRYLSIREATLADAASGLHVRLRLGGASFPPSIYYKIFTHRPIADIGAFGPRNYANENGVDPSPTSYPHPRVRVSLMGTVQAYVFGGLTDAATESETKRVAADWRHFARVTRQAARQKQRQRRALQWRAWIDDTSFESPEEEALLSWCTALDYETYLWEWQSDGWTMGSSEMVSCPLSYKTDV